MFSLLEKAKAAQTEIEEYGLPLSFIEQFVFEELFGRDTSDYVLPDILSPKFINEILERGTKIINSERTGRKLYNLGPKGSELKPPSADQYLILFTNWKDAGWVEISEVENNEIDVSVK